MKVEAFFQKMFPPPAPEQELIQLLVPASKLDKVMEDAVRVGRLNHAGAGAIFAMPCLGDVQHSADFPILEGNESSGESEDFAADMEAIICIVEIGTGDLMAEAALKSGSAGPTITYGEGGGVRDKIRLLRLTKGPEKEIVIAVVENDSTHALPLRRSTTLPSPTSWASIKVRRIVHRIDFFVSERTRSWPQAPLNGSTPPKATASSSRKMAPRTLSSTSAPSSVPA